MSEKTPIKQRFLYLADMNPPRKSKPGKVRPVIVIQTSDTLETGSPGVVVVPCTTKTDKENILRVPLTSHQALSLEKPSEVLLDQIHTIDRSLIFKELGLVAENDWQKIEQGIRFLLGL